MELRRDECPSEVEVQRIIGPLIVEAYSLLAQSGTTGNYPEEAINSAFDQVKSYLASLDPDDVASILEITVRPLFKQLGGYGDGFYNNFVARIITKG